MSVLKLSLVVVALCAGIGMTTASAMPIGQIGHAAATDVQDVRLVCNRWGHCWYTRGYYYGYRPYSGYGYRRPYYGHRYYRRW